MKARRLIGSAIGTLFITLIVSANAAHAQTLSTEGPYCPDLAPFGGRYVSSEIRDGRHYDTYLVPNFLGWKVDRVSCP
ncbi:hypothetical protein ACTMTI_24990 [Nonomuraea sp. H19]|uniref:hypothetical protein n=1 Tax=Nonomuraea sp. H19 TaxID=3452206 RepID=UPI003F8B1401